MDSSGDLSRYARRKTIALTTIGRRSGVPRRVVIWFVVDGPNSLLVQHVARKPAQWYQNLCADPNVQVDFGDGPQVARAQTIEDGAAIADVLAKIGRKYWTYRLIRLFGGGATDAVAARIEVL